MIKTYLLFKVPYYYYYTSENYWWVSKKIVIFVYVYHFNETYLNLRSGKTWILYLKLFMDKKYNFSLIIVGVAIVITIIVVVVCLKQGKCAKNVKGVASSGGVGLNNQPPNVFATQYYQNPLPPILSENYQNPYPPVFTQNYQNQQHPVLTQNYQNPPPSKSRLPPLNQVNEPITNILEKPPSYEPFINQNPTIGFQGDYNTSMPVLAGPTYPVPSNLNN